MKMEIQQQAILHLELQQPTSASQEDNDLTMLGWKTGKHRENSTKKLTMFALEKPRGCPNFSTNRKTPLEKDPKHRIILIMKETSKSFARQSRKTITSQRTTFSTALRNPLLLCANRFAFVHLTDSALKNSPSPAAEHVIVQYVDYHRLHIPCKNYFKLANASSKQKSHP